LIRAFLAAMFTWKGYSICAFITVIAVPFPPIPAFAADLTVPCAIILNNIIPAERIPVSSSAFTAFVFSEKILEPYLLTLTRQIVVSFKVPFFQFFYLSDVFSGTYGQFFQIHIVERVLATPAIAILITWFMVF